MLAADQRDLVIILTERIIPQTDTPGARAARVHEFIELMLSEWCTDRETSAFLQGLEEVDAVAERIQSVPRRTEPLRHGWLVHGVLGLPEPVPDLHGLHRAGSGLRGLTDA
jgi:hypothetical protein